MLQLIWNNLAYAGASGALDQDDEKYIVLLNSLSILISIFSFSITIVLRLTFPFDFLGELHYTPIFYGLGLFFTIVLNARQKYIVARLYFGLLSFFFIIYFSLAMGGGTNAYFYFLPGVLLYFFIFPARERRPMLLMVALSFTGFLAFQIFFTQIPGWLPLNEENRNLMRITNGCGAGILTLCLAAYISATFHRAERVLKAEMRKSEKLLLNILPAQIAAQLRDNPETIAERFENCTVLFSDIVGFTQLSMKLSAVEVVRMLNDIFSSFDDLSEQYGLEKIKTIGDAYMIVGGLPEPMEDHAEKVARYALEMLEIIQRYREKHDVPLELRIGISSGDAVAGVIGKKKFVYDLWGASVNSASRMESHGVAGRIQLTESTYNLLKGKFKVEERGAINVKGMGEVRSYLLLPQG